MYIMCVCVCMYVCVCVCVYMHVLPFLVMLMSITTLGNVAQKCIIVAGNIWHQHIRFAHQTTYWHEHTAQFFHISANTYTKALCFCLGRIVGHQIFHGIYHEW